VCSGCVTAENSLSQSDIASLRLTGVAVSFAPDARLQWEEGVRAYGNSKSLMDDQMMAASETPEGRAYLQAMLGPRIKTALEQALTSQIAGTRPVRLEIRVKNFIMASAAQRVIIGGGVISAGPLLFDALRDELARVEWRPFGEGVPVVPALLGEWAGAIGAARNVLQLGNI